MIDEPARSTPTCTEVDYDCGTYWIAGGTRNLFGIENVTDKDDLRPQPRHLGRFRLTGETYDYGQ